MKVLIIEDEKLAADRLKDLLLQINPGTEILASTESVEESANWLAKNPPPDLIFMDIQLDDGISFEIFETVNIESPVIFTTAYNEYAIRAFKVNSVDYLLKPIEKEALEAALKKFEKIYAGKNVEQQLSKVFEQFSKPWKIRFFVKVGARFLTIPVEEINCFFVEERCSFLRTRTGKNYDLDFSLDQVQKKVDPEMFFRINRNFIINIQYISEMISYSSSRLKIKMKDFEHEGLVVSRDKVSEFKHWLDR
ncbi:MAG TPA: LytTR family DNA-binding domain-containing protein [Tangfeifania sp.]|nr:LytTR family DNA-binding domain-containing protein [Tangfeifania sp.]